MRRKHLVALRRAAEEEGVEGERFTVFEAAGHPKDTRREAPVLNSKGELVGYIETVTLETADETHRGIYVRLKKLTKKVLQRLPEPRRRTAPYFLSRKVARGAKAA